MKHSSELSNRLLAKHYHRHHNGAVVTYAAKTVHSHKFWKHTGVCPECLRRAISAGRCIQCGHEPARVTLTDIEKAYKEACDE